MNEAQKNTNKAGLVIGGVVIVVLVIASLAFGKHDDGLSQVNSQQSTKKSVGLAESVDTSLKKNLLGVTSYQDPEANKGGPYFWTHIQRIENHSDDSVRVYYDIPLTDQDAKNYGIGMMNAVGTDVPQLSVIILQDSTGKDFNTFRKDIPALNN